MSKFLLLAILVITQVLGDIWLSQAMKLFGAVTSISPAAIAGLFTYLITSPWIWLGVSTLAFSMLVYLVAISRLDVSYVLPIHASSYVLNALMAWLILREVVSPVRWLATVIIGLGVFVVGWSEQYRSQGTDRKPRRPRPRKPKNSVAPLLLVVGGGSLPKLLLGVLILTLADSGGDLLSARGIKQVGEVPTGSVGQMWGWGQRAIAHPAVISGIVCYAIAFFMFISLLSWSDISLVRPATALGYVINLVGARYFLQEHISPGRLIGIILIGMGVTIVSLT